MNIMQPVQSSDSFLLQTMQVFVRIGFMKKHAVVIGAGYGGLSCSALLARDGWKVTLLEKNGQTGGRARNWVSDGFTFDMGPSWYLMPEVFDRYFSLFQANREDYYGLLPLNPYYKVFFSPSDHACLSPNLQENIKLFDSFEPGGGAALQRYIDQATYKYHIAMKEFLYRDYKHLTDFFNRRIIFEGLKLDVFKKLDSFVSTFVSDRRAKQILEYAMVFLGTSPVDAPALYSIMSHVDLGLGVYFPQGGMAGVAQGLEKLCREMGVDIQTNQEVTSISVTANQATAVHTREGSFSADIVVSGADYRHVECELLPPQAATYIPSYWDKRVVAPSMFIAYLGIGRRLSGLEHHNLYFSDPWETHFDKIFKHPQWPMEPCFYLSCISKTDASSAPEGCENVFILVPTAPGLADSEEQREAYFDHVIDHVREVTGEDLKQDILVKRIYSHRDFIQDYNAFKGTALGLSHTLRQTAVFRPASRSKKVRNLFYTGQYTHPGVGVPMVLIASEVAANEIRSAYGP